MYNMYVLPFGVIKNNKKAKSTVSNWCCRVSVWVREPQLILCNQSCWQRLARPSCAVTVGARRGDCSPGPSVIRVGGRAPAGGRQTAAGRACSGPGAPRTRLRSISDGGGRPRPPMLSCTSSCHPRRSITVTDVCRTLARRSSLPRCRNAVCLATSRRNLLISTPQRKIYLPQSATSPQICCRTSLPEISVLHNITSPVPGLWDHRLLKKKLFNLFILYFHFTFLHLFYFRHKVWVAYFTDTLCSSHNDAELRA